MKIPSFSSSPLFSNISQFNGENASSEKGICQVRYATNIENRDRCLIDPSGDRRGGSGGGRDRGGGRRDGGGGGRKPLGGELSRVREALFYYSLSSSTLHYRAKPSSALRRQPGQGRAEPGEDVASGRRQLRAEAEAE